jgi:glycerol-3-phosphate dehydrogenase
MAEDVIDQAEMVAGVEEQQSVTKTLQIKGWTKAEIAEPNLVTYGSQAGEVRGILREEPALSELLHRNLPYQEAEVVYHARKEMARTVEDVLARRTRALLLDARAARSSAPRVASLLARELKKDKSWETAEAERFEELAKGYIFQDSASTDAAAS